MPKLIMLVGLPGTGKSFWTDWKNDNNNAVVISTDNILTVVGSCFGMTYDQVFSPEMYSAAEKMMYHLAKYHIAKGDEIIWDQTNLTIKSRAKKLALFGPEYTKHALYFPIPLDHSKRLVRSGKTIPKEVLEGMQKHFQMPTKDEGFDEIVTVDNK